MNIPKKTTHTDPVFINIRIMMIEYIIKFESCKIAYCVKEKLLPTPILKLFNSDIKDIDTILDTKMYQT